MTYLETLVSAILGHRLIHAGDYEIAVRDYQSVHEAAAEAGEEIATLKASLADVLRENDEFRKGIQALAEKL